MKKITLFAAILAVTGMTVASCASDGGARNDGQDTETAGAVAEAAVAEAAPAEDVVSVNDDNQFRPGKAVETLTVLDFNATWCVPCKKLTPAYHKAAAEYGDKVRFYSVDIDNNKETAAAFGVQNVPTVVILSTDGNARTYVGLEPFLGGVSMEGLSADSLTDLIYTNLAKKIDETL